MTHDEIIKLVAYGKFQPEVAAWFIAYGMGAAAEREECIKACSTVDIIGADECIEAIRSRNEQ